jgi:hypothetical protein
MLDGWGATTRGLQPADFLFSLFPSPISQDP